MHACMHACIHACIQTDRQTDIYSYIHTVPTFNSCTKYMGNPGIMHDQTTDCHLVSGYGGPHN